MKSTLKNLLTCILCFSLSYVSGQTITSIPDLQIWLDPNSGVQSSPGVDAQVGDKVTNWVDKVNNRVFTQADVTKRPDYAIVNGKNAIRFYAGAVRNTELVYPNDFIGANDFTYFVVGSHIPITSNQQLRGALIGTAVSDLYLSNAQVKARVWNGVYQYADNDEVISNQNFYLASVSWSNTQAVVSFNGNRKTTPVTLRPSGLSVFMVGGNPSSVIEHLDGHIAEVIAFRRVLNESEYTIVENYLSSKYGIILPSQSPPTPPSNQLCPQIFCNDGNVGIGTADVPDGYMLAVGGKIITEGVKVLLKDKWPDYVFGDDYELEKLEHVKAYINEHKHLPGIKPAKEMEREGIDIEQMNIILLKKIEEMTLYMIELEERVRKLEPRH